MSEPTVRDHPIPDPAIRVHLVDGTYELFRHHFGVPSHLDGTGTEIAAVRGVVGSVLAMLEQGATHVGVATDHVIESFRNDLWAGYKTSAGVPTELLAQFPLLEDALVALGVAVWPMVELEADDGMASAAAIARSDPRVERVLLCTPDKDLGQCVEDPVVVQLDRRRDTVIDEAGVRAKFGVGPRSIPDYLALVGDSADGFPGLPGWGAKSAAVVLARYEHLDAIPDDATAWDVEVRGAAKLASTLATARDAARLFLDLATLRTTGDVGAVDDWEWHGPRPELADWARRLGADNLYGRATRLTEKRLAEKRLAENGG
jgi:5'-3' exonuclease